MHPWEGHTSVLAVRQSTPVSTIRTVSTAANAYQRRLPVLWDVAKNFYAVLDDPKALFGIKLVQRYIDFLVVRMRLSVSA